MAEDPIWPFSNGSSISRSIEIQVPTLEGSIAVKVPPGVRPEHAALAEPLSCCVNAAENCGLARGDTVVSFSSFQLLVQSRRSRLFSFAYCAADCSIIGRTID